MEPTVKLKALVREDGNIILPLHGKDKVFKEWPKLLETQGLELTLVTIKDSTTEYFGNKIARTQTALYK